MSQHPFDGQGFSYEDGLKFWDDAAEWYDASQQGDMPQRIVDDLFEKGILKNTDNVLELGSGPGTYSFILAQHCNKVLCLDTSPRMLNRLQTGAKNKGISNIECICGDFNEFSHDGSDVVFSSLCPGTGSVNGIERMESMSKRTCVYVMWLVNSKDDLNARIWKKLGKDYSFEGRKSGLLEKNLDSMSRPYERTVYRAHVSFTCAFEDAVKKEIAGFKNYGELEGLENAVIDVLSEFKEGDSFVYHGDNEMKVVTWSPGAEE